MLLDSDGKPTRVGYRRDDETGKNVRIAKSNGKDI
jgi:large subunit ribosomal protein L24